MSTEDIHVRLISLYNAYEQQSRNLNLLDWESLLGMARHHKPDLPQTPSKSACIDVIMEHSQLGRRIDELEKLEGIVLDE